MKKSLIMYLSLCLLLAGCTGLGVQSGYRPQRFPEPRPQTQDSSEAMRILYERFPATRKVMAAMDTAVWEDEVDFIRGGFDPAEVADNLYLHSTPVVGFKKTFLKYGTINPRMHEMLGDEVKIGAPTGTSLTSALLGGAKTDIAVSSTLFLADLALDSSNGYSREGVRFIQDVVYTNAALSYELTAPEKAQLDAIDDEKAEQVKVGRIVGESIMKMALSILEKKGFTIVGKTLADEKRGTLGVEVVNEAKGCPRATEDSKRCFFETFIGRSQHNMSGNHVSVDGVMDYRRSPAGYSSKVNYGLGHGRHLIKYEEVARFNRLNDEIYEELVKANPRLTVYFPARETLSRVWEAQHMLDKNGSHYFVVPVKR